jgi:hypothetical protein
VLKSEVTVFAADFFAVPVLVLWAFFLVVVAIVHKKFPYHNYGT